MSTGTSVPSYLGNLGNLGNLEWSGLEMPQKTIRYMYGTFVILYPSR